MTSEIVIQIDYEQATVNFILSLIFQVTWADIVVANFCDGVMMKGGDAIFGKNVFLKSHVKLILDLPNIKKWIEARAVTAM